MGSWMGPGCAYAPHGPIQGPPGPVNKLLCRSVGGSAANTSSEMVPEMGPWAPWVQGPIQGPPGPVYKHFSRESIRLRRIPQQKWYPDFWCMYPSFWGMYLSIFWVHLLKNL